MNIPVKKLKENATMPTYGSEYAAGADLYACIDHQPGRDSYDSYGTCYGAANGLCGPYLP